MKQLKSRKFSRQNINRQLAQPSVTGMIATAILLLMKLAGLMHINLFIIMLPAIVGILAEIRARQNGAPPDHASHHAHVNTEETTNTNTKTSEKPDPHK